MQTQERPTIEEPRDQRPRWLVPALAGAAVVILAIVVSVQLLGGRSEVIEPATTTTTAVPSRTGDAADVGAALEAAAGAGDWETVVGLFAEDATITLGPGTGFEGSVTPRADPSVLGDFLSGRDWEGSHPIDDWDGDFARTGFDSLAQDAMAGYALGFSVYESCSADGPSTLVCVAVWSGHPFPNTERGEEKAVHTVVDGLITDTMWDLSSVDYGNGAVVDSEAATEYEAWVKANRSELTEDVQLFRLTPGHLLISPDTVEIHRQLVAEWKAQR